VNVKLAVNIVTTRRYGVRGFDFALVQ
jgi:hypothetical protein